MKVFIFFNRLTREGIKVLEESESKAWKDLCETYGSGYVYENIYLCIPARKCALFLSCMDDEEVYD